MFGNILSGIIKVATCPIDMAESALDVACGGDGSKESKRNSDLPLPSALRDAICKPLEEMDDA